MFGRKKKPIAKFALMLFREGDKYWYYWMALNEKGQMDHDEYWFLRRNFDLMPHGEASAFWGETGFLEKVSEEHILGILQENHLGCILVGELPIVSPLPIRVLYEMKEAIRETSEV